MQYIVAIIVVFPALLFLSCYITSRLLVAKIIEMSKDNGRLCDECRKVTLDGIDKCKEMIERAQK